jgi:hypothetical protein
MTLHNNNYAIFRECISGSIAWKPEGKPTRAKRRNAKRAKHDLLEDASTEIVNERADPEELAEFIDVYLPIYLTSYYLLYNRDIIIANSVC